jgi:hypothetical protein
MAIGHSPVLNMGLGCAICSKGDAVMKGRTLKKRQKRLKILS